MKIIATALFIAALGAGCATAHNYPPEPVAGQPDTQRFKVYLANHATDSAADQAVVEDLDTFKAKNGYASYTIVGRRYVAIPTHIEYTVRFTK